MAARSGKATDRSVLHQGSRSHGEDADLSRRRVASPVVSGDGRKVSLEDTPTGHPEPLGPVRVISKPRQPPWLTARSPHLFTCFKKGLFGAGGEGVEEMRPRLHFGLP